jgi:hypothetical protein
MTLTDRNTLIVVFFESDTTCYSDRQTVEAVYAELAKDYPFDWAHFDEGDTHGYTQEAIDELRQEAIDELRQEAEAEHYADQRACVYEYTLKEALKHGYGYAWGVMTEDEYDTLGATRYDFWNEECHRAEADGKLWTAVDGDGECVVLIRGSHYVNRLWYEITEHAADACFDEVEGDEYEHEHEAQDEDEDTVPHRTPNMDNFLECYNAEPIYIWTVDGYTEGYCAVDLRHGQRMRYDFCEDEVKALEIILHLVKDEEKTAERRAEHPDALADVYLPQ